jgi:hypothetical protein
MKKVILVSMSLAFMTLISCNKEKDCVCNHPGGTQSMKTIPKASEDSQKKSCSAMGNDTITCYLIEEGFDK